MYVCICLLVNEYTVLTLLKIFTQGLAIFLYRREKQRSLHAVWIQDGASIYSGSWKSRERVWTIQWYLLYAAQAIVWCSMLRKPDSYSTDPGNRNRFFDPASEFLSTHWWSQNPACQRCFYKPFKNCHTPSGFLKYSARNRPKKIFLCWDFMLDFWRDFMLIFKEILWFF